MKNVVVLRVNYNNAYFAFDTDEEAVDFAKTMIEHYTPERCDVFIGFEDAKESEGE